MKANRARPVCYSPSLKYIFVHVPKCAGTSIHRGLHFLHEQRGLPLPPKSYHKHAKAVTAREVLGASTWNECFKFVIVRNPWDLMVSSYNWWLHYAEEFSSLREHAARVRAMGSFSSFVRSDYGRKMLNEHLGDDLFDWIADGNEIIIDFVGRYETLIEDWDKICRALNCLPVSLSHENRIAREGGYRSSYDEQTKEIVAKRFARTIAAFDYEF